jgi:hypothetical protein
MSRRDSQLESMLRLRKDREQSELANYQECLYSLTAKERALERSREELDQHLSRGMEDQMNMYRAELFSQFEQYRAHLQQRQAMALEAKDAARDKAELARVDYLLARRRREIISRFLEVRQRGVVVAEARLDQLQQDEIAGRQAHLRHSSRVEWSWGAINDEEVEAK